MDKFKIITNDGVEKEVDGIFYLYNSKYFFGYTEKEVDENDYVIFHLVQVGKEIQNTPSGPLDTGYMVGIEISDLEEWKRVQESITKIVDDKKNGTKSDEVIYLPQNMMSTLKIISTKTFRLTKGVVEQAFKLNLLSGDNSTISANQDTVNIVPKVEESILTPVELESAKSVLEIGDNVALNSVTNNIYDDTDSAAVSPTMTDVYIENNQSDVIIDYRARFFEEQEKNKQLEEQIKNLTEKLENIKLLIG